MQAFRVVFVGAAGTGKTSLARVLAKKRFDDATESTIGCCMFKMQQEVDCGAIQEVPLEIWDTASSECYAPLMSLYTRNADIVIFTHSRDTTREATAKAISRVRDTAGQPQTLALWQTKSDLLDNVFDDDFVRSQFSIIHYSAFVSAKTKPNEVRSYLKELVEAHVNSGKWIKPRPEARSINTDAPARYDMRSCCRLL